MGDPILCLNAGSSSLKAALFIVDETQEQLAARGIVERIGSGDAHLLLRDGGGPTLVERPLGSCDRARALDQMLAAIDASDLPQPVAVGHRVVHGGPDFDRPLLVTPRTLGRLRRLSSLAPLHVPQEVEAMERIAAREPSLAQVACFDTGFFARLPHLAKRLPLPAALWEEGIRRYGFHGLSYESVLATLGPAGRGKLIVAHLGSGASLAAIEDGVPVDTTMGLTPLGGLMMGTRAGDLDPGVLLHLLREKGYTADSLQRLLNKESGLLGVSGSSADMQTLLAAAPTDARAEEAVELFCRQARKHIGAMAGALNGLDTLAFTGGVGEHAAEVRRRIGDGLTHLGVRLDPNANRAHADVISSDGSRCTVRVVRTDEERIIARGTYQARRG